MGILEDLFSLSGRVAIVTGGSRGLGAAIASGLAAAGADVFAVGRSAAPPPGAGGGFAYRACDVTDTAGFADLVQDVAQRRGRLDILVNAAAITRPASAGPQSLDDFDATIAADLRAAYANSIAAAGPMADSGGGSIVNVTSVGSVLGFAGNPGYVAAKGGLRMLTRALAMDLADRNIRVNNLAPGYMRTAMTAASHADPPAHEARRRHTILGRWGEPADVVGAAIFLASGAASYVTGIDLFVDGGWTAKGLT
jgi:NAD(P)-dependent dehydrogenase (short-subunit alcohol dehydrogenase family)